MTPTANASPLGQLFFSRGQSKSSVSVVVSVLVLVSFFFCVLEANPLTEQQFSQQAAHWYQRYLPFNTVHSQSSASTRSLWRNTLVSLQSPLYTFISWNSGNYGIISNGAKDSPAGELIQRSISNQFEGKCLFWRSKKKESCKKPHSCPPQAQQWICHSKQDIYLLTMRKHKLLKTTHLYSLPKGRIMDWSLSRGLNPGNTVEFVTCCRDVYSLNLETRALEAQLKIQTTEKISSIFSVQQHNEGDYSIPLVYAIGQHSLHKVDLNSEKQESVPLPSEYDVANLTVVEYSTESFILSHQDAQQQEQLLSMQGGQLTSIETSSVAQDSIAQSHISGDLAAFSLFFTRHISKATPIPKAAYSNIVTVQDTTGKKTELILATTVLGESEDQVSVTAIAEDGSTFPVFMGPFKQYERGPILAVYVQDFFVSDQVSDISNIRLLFVFSDNSLSMISNQKLIWTREDSLARFEEAFFFRLPSREVVEHRGALVQLLDRFNDIVSILNDSFRRLIAVGSTNQTPKKSSASLWNDGHGFNRLIVGVTASKKVVALHSQTGEIVWSMFYPSATKRKITGPLNIYEGDANHFFLVAPEDSAITMVKTITGEIVSEKVFTEFDFNRVVALPYSRSTKHSSASSPSVEPSVSKNSQLSTLLVLLNEENQVRVFPETVEAQRAFQNYKDVFYFDINESSGQINGYTLSGRDSENSALPTWAHDLHSPIAAVSTVDQSAVYSTVYQTGSGALLHKYLNPHLIAVATVRNLTTDSISSFQPHFLDLYVINSVTGKILFHTSQDFVSGPIRLVFEHNILLCHFLNEKSRKFEVSVFEFFTSDDSHTHRSFLEALFARDHHKYDSVSSFEMDMPQTSRQSYVLSAGGVEVIRPTKTSHGLTQKQFLFGMKNGRVLCMDKKVLDTRRPTDGPTNDSAKEGLVPYNPFITLSPAHHYLTHNYTVENINDIIVHPSDMESTMHVLVTGSDLFYMRHAPSTQFDMLGGDFSHILLAATIVGLAVISQIAKYFAKRSALRKEWE